MAIVHDEELVPANLVHRNQIVDRLLKRLERFEMFEVANVLAHKCLPVDDQRDCIFQIGAERENRALGWKAQRLRWAHIRETDEELPDRKRRREQLNRQLAARSDARLSRKHPQCRRGAPERPRHRRRSVRSNGSRLSLPEFPARLRQTTNDEEACRAA